MSRSERSGVCWSASLLMLWLCWAAPSAAQPTDARLSIYAATDRSAFAPLLAAFSERFPRVAVDYQDLNSLNLYQRFLMESEQGGSADLLISSAIDLQFKLANDGHALAYASPAARELPAWAVWRNEIFGFTFEPVVMVYNRAELAARDIPRTHGDLTDLLRRQPQRFRGRIGTYDPAKSGVGYLFATQDAEQFPGFWDLVAALSASEVRLHNTTAAILHRVAEGEYLLGYNVLGSYAQTRAQQDPRIGVVLPEDYTQVMSRVVLIPRNAPHPQLARQFVDFLLSREGQQIIADQTGLTAIHPAVQGERTASQLARASGNSLRPIRIGPGLLVYRDRLKRLNFLGRWSRVLDSERWPVGVVPFFNERPLTASRLTLPSLSAVFPWRQQDAQPRPAWEGPE